MGKLGKSESVPQELSAEQIVVLNNIKFDFDMYRGLDDESLENTLMNVSDGRWEPPSEESWDVFGQELEKFTGENLDYLYSKKEGGWRLGVNKSEILRKAQDILSKYEKFVTTT